MAKRIMAFCTMLLATSLGYIDESNAIGFGALNVKMPIEFMIDARDPNHPRADFLNLKSELREGSRWVMLPQVAAMFNPNDSDEPVVLVDVKRTVLKMIAKNPELAAQAGIGTEDFANAGVSEKELLELGKEAMKPEEVSLLSQIGSDILHGGASRGLEYICGGGFDLVKGGAKIGLGSAILLKKATAVILRFVYESVSQHVSDKQVDDK